MPFGQKYASTVWVVRKKHTAMKLTYAVVFAALAAVVCKYIFTFTETLKYGLNYAKSGSHNR